MQSLQQTVLAASTHPDTQIRIKVAEGLYSRGGNNLTALKPWFAMRQKTLKRWFFATKNNNDFSSHAKFNVGDKSIVQNVNGTADKCLFQHSGLGCYQTGSADEGSVLKGQL